MVADIMHAAADPAAHFPIPNLVFENRTALDAMQFDTVDQHDATFHVVVAKTAYLLGACENTGMAALAPVAGARLNVEDRYFDAANTGSVRHESDIAPYKPACDVIVNATAHVPGGKPVSAFTVRLTVRQAGHTVIDKTLAVSGERSFEKKAAPSRLVQWTGKLATAGRSQPNPWRLGPAQDATNLPLRYEFANGGECRIDAVGHEASEENPCGRGFARRWYLDAKRLDAVAAPRIHALDKPLTAQQFWHVVNGGTLPAPSGMGTVGRGWMPRRALAGTFVDKASWAADDVPRLPDDFDFAYYNCAPRDQQCAWLSGEETFTLLNLCSANHPAARVDATGNTVLRFALPRQALFLLAADDNAQLMVKRMVIDTVTIEPEEGRVELVWRALLPTDAGLRRARMMQITEAAQIARLDTMLQVQAHVGHGASVGSQSEVPAP